MQSIVTDFFQSLPLVQVILLIVSALVAVFLLWEVLVLQRIIGRLKSVYGLRKNRQRKRFQLKGGRTDFWQNILAFPVRTIVGTAHFSLGQLGVIYTSVLLAAYAIYLVISFAF